MFEFPINIYLLGFTGGLVLLLVILPTVTRLCLKYDQVDNPGYRKIHSTPVPLAGGPAIILTIIGVFMIGAPVVFLFQEMLNPSLVHKIQYGFSHKYFEIFGIVAGATLVTTMGFLDDRKEWKAAPKLLFQIIAALIIYLSGIKITLFLSSPFFQFILTFLWILILVNAFNFMDNMNGASAGLAFIAILFCSISGHQSDQYLVPLLGFTFCGIILGFLFWNYPKGKVFLGDSGSHLLGFLVAVHTIKSTYYTDAATDLKIHVLSPLFFVAIPLIDLLQVTLYRLWIKKPVWVGDNNHLTHRLAQTKLGKIWAVFALWVLALILGCIPILFS